MTDRNQTTRREHVLKILPVYLDAVLDGSKTFEIRNNDRDFRTGDRVILVETGSEIIRAASATIGHVSEFMQQPGYVTFSILGVRQA